LIPTDGSLLSETAVRQGVALARSLHARVTALTISLPFHAFAIQPEMVTVMPAQYPTDCEAAAARALARGGAATPQAGRVDLAVFDETPTISHRHILKKVDGPSWHSPCAGLTCWIREEEGDMAMLVSRLMRLIERT
jgi:hypothetical protein